MTWDDFRDALQDTLRQVTDRCYLVVSAPGAGGGFAQFAGGRRSLDAEVSGPDLVAGAAAHSGDDSTMLAAGWTPPTRPQPNWSAELRRPALTAETAALVDRCVVALRDVLHVPDPGLLTYRSWREAETQPPGATWTADRIARLDPGQNPLPLPRLGLELRVAG